MKKIILTISCAASILTLSATSSNAGGPVPTKQINPKVLQACNTSCGQVVEDHYLFNEYIKTQFSKKLTLAQILKINSGASKYRVDYAFVKEAAANKPTGRTDLVMGDNGIYKIVPATTYSWCQIPLDINPDDLIACLYSQIKAKIDANLEAKWKPLSRNKNYKTVVKYSQAWWNLVDKDGKLKAFKGKIDDNTFTVADRKELEKILKLKDVAYVAAPVNSHDWPNSSRLGYYTGFKSAFKANFVNRTLTAQLAMNLINTGAKFHWRVRFLDEYTYDTYIVGKQYEMPPGTRDAFYVVTKSNKILTKSDSW